MVILVCCLAIISLFLLVIDLAHVIQAEVDRQLRRNSTPVEFVGILDRPYNDLRYLLDYSKINLDTGWSPKVTFEEGNFLRCVFHEASSFS